MKNYFKCEVAYVKGSETEEEKLVTEHYLVEAVNYTEAETVIHQKMEEMLAQVTFTVKKIDKAKIHEIIDLDGGADFWLAKTSFITTNDAGKEKKTVENVLVNASGIKKAMEKLVERFKENTSAVHTRIIGLAETTILEVY